MLSDIFYIFEELIWFLLIPIVAIVLIILFFVSDKFQNFILDYILFPVAIVGVPSLIIIFILEILFGEGLLIYAITVASCGFIYLSYKALKAYKKKAHQKKVYKKALENFEKLEKGEIDAGYISKLTPLKTPNMFSFGITGIDLKKESVSLDNGIITLKYKNNTISESSVMLFCEGILLKYNSNYYFHKYSNADIQSIVVTPIIDNCGSPFEGDSNRKKLNRIISNNYYYSVNTHTEYYTDKKYYTKDGISIDRRYSNYPIYTKTSYTYDFSTVRYESHLSCLYLKCSVEMMENIVKQICEKMGWQAPTLKIDTTKISGQMLLGIKQREQLRSVINELSDSQIDALVNNLSKYNRYSDSEWSTMLKDLNIKIGQNEDFTNQK